MMPGRLNLDPRPAELVICCDVRPSDIHTKRCAVKILVIDPDPHFRAGLADALSQAGHQVREAATTAEGLEAWGNEVFPIVVLDHQQTENVGQDPLRAIRGDDANVGVIICSTGPSVDDVVSIMKRGADDLITRPCPAADVVAAVGQVVRRRGFDDSAFTQVNVALGGLVRQTRLERKLTLKNLANRIGLSVSLISQIEMGKTSASISTLHKICCALGVRLSSLFEKL